MQFSSAFLDEIRSRILVSEVVRRKVALKASGGEFSGLCPFHNEKSPSFTVSDAKGFYHCFGCGAHGDVIKFVLESEKLPFVDVVKYLADLAGLALPKEDYKAVELEKERSSFFEVMEMACDYYCLQLRGNMAESARAYLKNRGISEGSVKRFGIGFAPSKGDALKSYLSSKGVTISQMVELGLVTRRDKSGVYDKFRGRIVFPIRDVKGRAVAFGGRALGDIKPKYLNSPETPLFKKSDILYNENLARQVAFKTGKLVVAEGYMDVIALDAVGIRSAVAPLGTALTQNHMKRLWGMVREPVICLDGDVAGLRAMGRAARLCLPMLRPGFTLRFAMLQEGMDPDDCIRTGGVELMRKVLQGAVSLSEVLWDTELNKKNVSTPEGKADLERRLGLLCKEINDGVVAKYYMDYFKKALWNLSRKSKISRYEGTRSLEVYNLPDFDINSISGCETMLVLLILISPGLLDYGEVYESFANDNLEFESIELDKVRKAILDMKVLGKEMSSSDVLCAYLSDVGLGAGVQYLVNLKKELLIKDNSDISKTLIEWRYHLYRRNMLDLRRECQTVERQMDPDSEYKVAEFRKEIVALESQVALMEVSFGEE